MAWAPCVTRDSFLHRMPPNGTTTRCRAAPALGYETFIAVHRGPSPYFRHAAADKCSQPNSNHRPDDDGGTTEDNGGWKGVLNTTTPLPLHPNASERWIATPLKGRATYACTAERSSGEVTATSEELDASPHQATRSCREMWPCHPLPRMCRGKLGQSWRCCVAVHLGQREVASNAGFPASSTFPGAAEALDF
ncbi:hypothetical protein MTO96_035714 [Rhipicephalus appendiculatus]